MLVVEDNVPSRQPLSAALSAHGYDVLSVARVGAALDVLAQRSPDLVVVDLGLAETDGAEVIERIRACALVPVLVLSGGDCEAAKVRALDAGADDYIVKPYGMEELLARIRVVLRRAGDATKFPIVATAAFSIDLANHRIRARNGSLIRLTPTEWGILELLAHQPGRLITHREILEKVWGPQWCNETHYLRVYIRQLRRKLEPDPARPQHLITEPGFGYRLERGQ